MQKNPQQNLTFLNTGVPLTHGALSYRGSEGALSMAPVGIKIMAICFVYEYFLICIQKELQILSAHSPFMPLLCSHVH